MKQMIKYAALIFALFLAASIIGGCISAGIGVVQMLVERTQPQEEWDRTGNTTKNEVDIEVEEEENNFFGIRWGDSEVKSGTETFDASDIQSLEIQDLNGELVIEPWEKDYIEVVYEDIPVDYVIEKSGDVLLMEDETAFFMFHLGFFSGTPKIQMKVPRNSIFEEVYIDKGSGSVKMSEVTADVVELDSGSGSVNVSKLTADTVYVNSGSGSVNISDVNAEEVSVDSGSGSVTLSEITAQNTILDSGSGTVTVKDSVIGEASVNTGSGFVNFDEVTSEDIVLDSGSGRVNYIGWLTGNCVFETSSGSVNLELYAEEEDYNIRADLGSGGLYINGEKERDTDIEYDDAQNLLILDSGSGRVSVNFRGTRERDARYDRD